MSVRTTYFSSLLSTKLIIENIIQKVQNLHFFIYTFANLNTKISADSALFKVYKMTGYELRLWRKGMNWSSDRAAEELGVSLRTWKVYEKSEKVSRVVELATITLSVAAAVPSFGHRKTTKEKIVTMIQTLTGSAGLIGRR
jgi:predicted transcriptional regulator